MSTLIGKHIVCHLESAAGNTPNFSAEVRPGRHEGEVYLLPHHAHGHQGYVDIFRVFVREVLAGGPPDAPAAAAPAAEAVPVEFTPPAAPPADLTDDRRLSRNPVSTETRRRHGRGGPVDHGAQAAQPDEFAEKP